MELNVPIDVLRKRKLFVATPAYGGMCHAGFAKSMSDLTALCTHYGIEMCFHLLMNESLIQRARNYCTQSFLDSNCTHLLFIDSDISFRAEDAITFLAMMSDESEFDVLCAAYSKKTIAAEKLVRAVNMGLVDEDPNLLEQYVGDYCFNTLPGTKEISLSEPCEVLESGTGFMALRRKTLEKFRDAYPHKMYLPDHVRSEGFDGSREICAFFDCEICPDTKRYLSEDFLFCQRVRQAGMKVWLAPWVVLSHTGTYTFGQGGLAAQAKLGVSPTADPAMLKKSGK